MLKVKAIEVLFCTALNKAFFPFRARDYGGNSNSIIHGTLLTIIGSVIAIRTLRKFKK